MRFSDILGVPLNISFSTSEMSNNHVCMFAGLIIMTCAKNAFKKMEGSKITIGLISRSW
jgi:hypothetical protein